MYDGVVFHPKGEVSFSDSEWVVVTDVSWNKIDKTLQSLTQWVKARVDFPPLVRRNASADARQLQERAVNLATGTQLELGVINNRLDVLKAALQGPGENGEV